MTITSTGPTPESGSIRQLTHVENLIWIGQRMAGSAPVYNMALAITLRGVDANRFAQAYPRMAEGFAPLRASVRNSEAGPLLDLVTAQPRDLELLDLRAENDALASAKDWMERAAAEPFDLDEPLVRSALIRIDDDDYIWFVNQHHIVTDAWSCKLMVAAMDRAYRDEPGDDVAAAIGQLPPAKAITESRLEEARSHWRRVYRGVPQQDPTFGRLNPDRDAASDRLCYHLDAEEVTRLQAVASREFRSFSPHMSLFIAFSTLLVSLMSRISQRRSIGFEAPFANRATKRAQQTPGLFIELFPLAADVDGASTFASVGAQIQKQLPETVKYGIPGSSVPTGNNGCDAVLNFIPFLLGDFDGAPVQAEFVHPGAHDAAHALRLQVWDLRSDGGLTIMFDMNHAMIGAENQDTVIGYFKSLMAAFIEQPEARVASIPLLPDAQRRKVIDDYNDTGDTPLPQQPIVQTIYEQAGRTPDAPALACQGDRLSYAELTARVDAAAAALADLGISAGDRVCISATRSMALIESILAVMRLGATYVPVDPDYPASRRAAIYENVQPQLLLSDDGRGDAAAGGIHHAVMADLRNGETAAEAAQAALPAWSQLGLDDLAYVLFTSGSTGKPKGVPVSQEGLAVYLHWAASVYGDEGPVTMPLLTSIAFDLTVTSMFLPLLSGGCVVVYTPTTDAFDDSLFRAVEDDLVDTIKLTPSHLRMLQRLDLHRSRIRNLIVGGEQLTTDVADAIDRQFGNVRIFNEYGPTEAVVGCMIHQHVPSDAATNTLGSHAVPIGRPAAHTRIYLLNEARQPVHPEVTGEIYVHRTGAPTAYLDAPDATAGAFFPDLVAPQETMYRTGDLARFNANGDLVYLGRIDQQVKVAGHRVETEEIESALTRVAGVEDCSVLLDRPAGSAPAAVVHCSECGIGNDTPGIKLDQAARCNLCRDFDKYAGRVDAYFREREQLREVIAEAAKRKTGEYDCMALLSGGKDSSYALYQLVNMGFKVYGLTLDNGFISPEALANAQRVVDDLGIDHEFASSEHMPEIFRDSLSRFSNVCQGCFKTIYTLSLRRADELGIPVLVTGLSRGQLFETRLNLGLFHGNRSDEEIDRTVLQARKAYHRRNDAVTRCLGNEEFLDDDIFERIQLVDFYRYWSASLTEMLDFLQTRAPWVRPADTGRSTNCLINDVGIHVHRKERGFHNYAVPYSWDVRLQQKDREQAVHELNDDIDAGRVREILEEIDYQPVHREDRRAEQLVAFYAAAEAKDPEQLRGALEDVLPAWAVPHRFIHVDSIPLTVNGKVDKSTLLAKLSATPSSQPFRTPETEGEEAVAELWAELLPVVEIGADDNFFELGGTSIEAIEFMTRLCDGFGVELPLDLIFNKPVLAEVAVELESALVAQIEGMTDAEVRAALENESA
ncbi:MAG: amino acid adenylation domain-containing protein [Woeseiaceae bacterium]|nr:amino acid adenylation domain-containing protein [Woeseiaceae bacterium]